MTYTQLSVVSMVLAGIVDLAVLRVGLLRRRLFWVAEGIIVFCQLISNGFLTGLDIVRYSGDAILGQTSPTDGSAPAMFGAGRLVFAPLEDLGFGFALVLLTLSLWVWWGRRGVQRVPVAGPPRISRQRRS